LRISFNFLVIRRKIIKDSKAYLAKRKANLHLRQELSDQIDFLNSLEGNAFFGQTHHSNILQAFVDENEPGPFIEQNRDYSEGEMRIRSFLVLNEDIFSLVFVS
jgi:hypothetical protein